MRRSLVAAGGALMIGTPATAETRTVANIGLNNSESARYDAASDRWLVSNIGPRGADNDGFITLVSPDGTVLDPKWIAGGVGGVTLVDPLGMAIQGNTVYVADTATVRTFDCVSGKPGAAYPIPGAIRLNDLTVDDKGVVYVTDSGNDDTPGAIFRIRNGQVSEFAKRDPALERPNGIAVMADGNIVHGGRGVNLVIRSPAGKIVREITLPIGRFDGIVALPDNGLLVASQDGHLVYRVPPAGKAVAVVSDIPIPAAIGLDTKRHRLVVPQIVASTLTFVDLP
ncbi:MAG: SMP-30/gluconolactonase/LRE family protein [Sandarakinorhabdus sp.]|nr:SMP-30/gluconolactonase/LRE family protein [Sandarakinorhabdus sp.]